MLHSILITISTSKALYEFIVWLYTIDDIKLIGQDNTTMLCLLCNLFWMKIENTICTIGSKLLDKISHPHIIPYDTRFPVVAIKCYSIITANRKIRMIIVWKHGFRKIFRKGTLTDTSGTINIDIHSERARFDMIL